jgi:Bacterial Ig-like domain (group 1)
MTNTHAIRVRGFFTAGALALVQGCGGDLVLPPASGEGVNFTILGGNDQTGTVGEELPQPLVVSVESSGGPVRGQRVAFVISGETTTGRITPDTAVTGPDGTAVVNWVLGEAAGPYEVEARLVVSEPDPPPTTLFEADAVAGEPDTLRAVSPASQPGRIGQAVPDSPTVLVVDRFGNPVGGAAVSWEVTAGGGEVNSGETATGDDGRASVTWTLGLGIGLQKLVARVSGAHGSPVTFTATVLF